mmetsp:Transcript_10556/g.30155  ORF Transcript_10556/g.30155 Transcript_10556/m.30155 type:complete len:206 (+) Transcript_10556:410-1027(+)
MSVALSGKDWPGVFGRVASILEKIPVGSFSESTAFLPSLSQFRICSNSRSLFSPDRPTLENASLRLKTSSSMSMLGSRPRFLIQTRPSKICFARSSTDCPSFLGKAASSWLKTPVGSNALSSLFLNQFRMFWSSLSLVGTFLPADAAPNGMVDMSTSCSAENSSMSTPFFLSQLRAFSISFALSSSDCPSFLGSIISSLEKTSAY